MTSRPWMPLYVGSYLKNTNRLTTEGHGAYLLLIMDYWTSGPLPNDDDQLATITRLPVRSWRKLRPTIEPFFQVAEGRWTHERIDHEIAVTAEKQRRRVEAGAKGGKAAAKSKQKPSNATSIATAISQQTDNGRYSIAEPLLYQSQSQSQREDGGTDARAREPLIAPEAHAIADRLLSVVGFADPLDIPPEWCGIPNRAQVWFKAGWTLPMIEATARKVMEGRSAPPHPNYFEKAFANAFASLNAPVPQGKATEKQLEKTGNVIDAADRLIERIADFDRPAPADDLAIPDFLKREGELRSREGADIVRAISSRERG